MKALSIILVVIVVVLTGISALLFNEVRAVRAELTDMRSKTHTVVELDSAIAQNTRELVSQALRTAHTHTEKTITISERDWRNYDACTNQYLAALDAYNEAFQRHIRLSDMRLALLKGSDD